MSEFVPTSWETWRRWEAERRLRVLRVSPSLLVHLCKHHNGDRYYVNTTDALPDDAVLVDVRVTDRAEWGERDLTLLVASASFEPVDEGATIPPIRPEVTVTYTGDQEKTA